MLRISAWDVFFSVSSETKPGHPAESSSQRNPNACLPILSLQHLCLQRVYRHQLKWRYSCGGIPAGRSLRLCFL